MWRLKDDDSEAIISANKNMFSAHRRKTLQLPKNALVIYMKDGIDILKERYRCFCISQEFPRFLNTCPIYLLKEKNICFLDGGRGAPQAVDTLEVLASCGVKKVISIGLCGAFDEKIKPTDILLPVRAYVEEGTSLHYYEHIVYSTPSDHLKEKIERTLPQIKQVSIVSCDAIYRQTYKKEAYWRTLGCSAVDMETSALYSVGRYLKIEVASLLLVSDLHPIRQDLSTWKWTLRLEDRKVFLDYCMKLFNRK